jgi:predicted small secreted protein
MKKFVSILLLASFVLALSACNTIEGVGKDVQKAGEAVEDAAKD